MILVSADTIRRAFSEYLAQFNGMTDDETREVLVRVLRQTPGEYADEHTERFYQLLRKHAEAIQ